MKNFKNFKEVDLYKKIRNEICEDNNVHCLAFTTPLMYLGQDEIKNENDFDEETGELAIVLSARKKWKLIFENIKHDNTMIPLKQMAWKSKHEDLIFEEM